MAREPRIDRFALVRIGAVFVSEALEIDAERSGRIDAAVLDMTMPVMDGEETIKRLIARWPERYRNQRFDLWEAGRSLPVGPAGFLQKPCTATQLIFAVTEAVRSRA
jgi:DNA-binding NarL/FixJ family response regulator